MGHCGHVVLWGARRRDWQLGSPRDLLDLTDATLDTLGMRLVVSSAMPGDMIGAVSPDAPAVFLNTRTRETFEVVWAGRLEHGTQQLRVSRR